MLTSQDIFSWQIKQVALHTTIRYTSTPNFACYIPPSFIIPLCAPDSEVTVPAAFGYGLQTIPDAMPFTFIEILWFSGDLYVRSKQISTFDCTKYIIPNPNPNPNLNNPTTHLILATIFFLFFFSIYHKS
ncbi:hypothetical protein AX774_g6979 [Zancudomyces culisetae]|uniref:Uncharacterized protein n=2 Tax=Zancudomyces culisetae TaxID=1213189 RepID=A0A1R1PF61_ZANCU|nr:hypothetical protein AX774_g6979 [Zancudomyces culisetae]|eukprot:OMH79607.1 hypothetical protein AX774_g6979 [Zancudomyces culisetae]